MRVARLPAKFRSVRNMAGAPLWAVDLLARTSTAPEVIENLIEHIERGKRITRRQIAPGSNVRDATLRQRITAYVSEAEPLRLTPRDDVAEFADALADLMGRIRLPPPDALQLAEAVRTRMPDASTAEWKELGLALVALAAALQQTSGDDDTEPPLPTEH